MTEVPAKYADYYALAIAGGVSEREVLAAIADMVRVEIELDALRCPECGADVRRTIDSNQGGPTLVVGTWFLYRCVACRFFCARCEPTAVEA